MKDIIYTPLVNYYGRVTAYKKEGKYWICLPDHSSESEVEISQEFFNSMLKEFEEFNIWAREKKKKDDWWQ